MMNTNRDFPWVVVFAKASRKVSRAPLAASVPAVRKSRRFIEGSSGALRAWVSIASYRTAGGWRSGSSPHELGCGHQERYGLRAARRAGDRGTCRASQRLAEKLRSELSRRASVTELFLYLIRPF